MTWKAIGFALLIMLTAAVACNSETQPAFPQVPKPEPVEITFKGCSPDGDGGDRQLNQLKNRVDEGTYNPVALSSLLHLPWPKGTERRSRTQWSKRDTGRVGRYEGTPVVAEGYLTGARLEGPEASNCHGADAPLRDFHVWLTEGPGEDRSRAVVVEVTPRVRAKHPGWRVETLNGLAREQDKVRISGWLMLDQEHPDQVGKTRGTLWEIHPILQIEAKKDEQWVALDVLAGTP